MKYIVISGDMENSRDSLFEGGEDKVILSRLKSFNEKFKGVLVYPAAVFKGDELQCVISAYNLKYICKIITGLYYCFFPYRLHIGIGAGAIQVNPLADKGISNSLAATGEAFYLAREAVETAKQKHGKQQYRIYFKYKGERQELINLLFLYYDRILRKWKKETYEIISLLEDNKPHKVIAMNIYGKKGDNLREIADSLRSNITYKIKNSDYYLLRQTEENIIKLLEEDLKGE